MKDKTLILVNPPQRGLLEGFPFGLTSIGSFLSRWLPSLTIYLLDLGLTSIRQYHSKVAVVLEQCKGMVFVGITCTTATYAAALEVARIFKQLDRACVVVFGGSHPSVQDTLALRHAEVDFVIRGEGEVAFLQLIQNWPNLHQVQNLSFRHSGNIQQNAQGPLLEQRELDEISLIFAEEDIVSGAGRFGRRTYISARGCPLRCAFCAVGDVSVRSKSIAAVEEDLRLLTHQLHYKTIAIEDNFFAQSSSRTIALCRAIETLQAEIPFSWDCQTRVESLCKPEVIDAMRRAGCDAVYIGVEALDPELLLYLRKTRSPGSYLRQLTDSVIPLLLDSDIQCYLNLQLGILGEGEAHIETTLRKLQILGKVAANKGKTICIMPQLHVIYPGTLVFSEARNESRLGPNEEDVFERFTQWEARQELILRWLGGRFAHGTGGIPEFILEKDKLRRRGDFEIDSHAILHLVDYLDRMEHLLGISVFRYASFLAGECEPPADTPQELLERGLGHD